MSVYKSYPDSIGGVTVGVSVLAYVCIFCCLEPLANLHLPNVCMSLSGVGKFLPC